jgi:hypothetical protein
MNFRKEKEEKKEGDFSPLCFYFLKKIKTKISSRDSSVNLDDTSFFPPFFEFFFLFVKIISLETSKTEKKRQVTPKEGLPFLSLYQE